MSLLDLPVGEVEAGEETPREYLERTLLLPSLECAVEQMLKVRLGLRVCGVHRLAQMAIQPQPKRGQL